MQNVPIFTDLSLPSAHKSFTNLLIKFVILSFCFVCFRLLSKLSPQSHSLLRHVIYILKEIDKRNQVNKDELTL
jgi:hypothetical protein